MLNVIDDFSRECLAAVVDTSIGGARVARELDRITYASDGEMAAALADLNRQIAGATARISVVRIQSSKGL